jgi:hypothetical protein
MHVITVEMGPEMESANKFFLPGILLLLTLASGLWLSNSDKPLNMVVFTLHKLFALGAVIFTVIQFFNILKNSEVQTIVIALIGIAGICALALFASGALMSMGKLNYGLLLMVHRAAPVPLIAAVLVSITLLTGRTS